MITDWWILCHTANESMHSMCSAELFLSYSVLYISCSKSVNLFSSACVLVDVNLQLFHATFFTTTTCAPPHFNVIANFLAQCGSEPRTTTITAGAICCTPLWVPQRVIKVPLEFKYASVPRLTKIVLSHKWRCSWTRVGGGTGAIGGSANVQMWFLGVPWVTDRPST